MNKRSLAILLLPFLAAASAGCAPSPTPASSSPWREEEVAFPYGPSETLSDWLDQLYAE